MSAEALPSWLNSGDAPAPEAGLGDALNPTQESAAPDGQQAPAEGAPAPEAGLGDALAPEAKVEGDAKPVEGAYEPFTLPEGFTVAEQDLAVFTQLGQEYKLPQEGAQKLVDLAVGVVENTRRQIAEEASAEAEAARKEWHDALKNDPELGGDKLKSTQDNITAFGKSKLADPALVSFLQDSGLLAHPEIARLLSRVGRSLRENPISFGADKPNNQRSPAHEIYAKSGHV